MGEVANFIQSMRLLMEKERIPIVSRCNNNVNTIKTSFAIYTDEACFHSDIKGFLVMRNEVFPLVPEWDGLNLLRFQSIPK